LEKDCIAILSPLEQSAFVCSVRWAGTFAHSSKQTMCNALMHMFPLKSASSSGGSGPPSNTWFLGSTRVSPQMASWLVQPFLHSSSVCPTHRQTKASCNTG